MTTAATIITGEPAPAGETGNPATPGDFANWPVPVGRVETRDGLTYVYSADPGGFTVADYRRIPGKKRVELLDGVAVLGPPPAPAHRRAARNLHLVLDQACPGGAVFFSGLVDLRIGRATVLAPDIQSIPTETGNRYRPLVVDILPGHGRAYGPGVRAGKYRLARIACYWVLDPDTATLTTFELAPGGYRETGRCVGDQECAPTRPFPLRFRVADLLRS
jgi:hypothetical protein